MTGDGNTQQAGASPFTSPARMGHFTCAGSCSGGPKENITRKYIFLCDDDDKAIR